MTFYYWFDILSFKKYIYSIFFFLDTGFLASCMFLLSAGTIGINLLFIGSNLYKVNSLCLPHSGF